MMDTIIGAKTVPGIVTGGPKLLLRLEGLALGCAAIILYGWSGASWLMFAVLFLAPDVSFLGYLAGPRVGASVYNAVHSTLAPILLGTVGFVMQQPLALHLALSWLAHIGIDRAVCYGLKYNEGFAFTHLGLLGNRKPAQPQ
jgi:hypothetical protein